MSNAPTPPVQAPAAPSGAERAFPAVACGLFSWLLVWIWLSWPYSLDDALIHLRYADHLLHQHRITYDGVHDSFGTSSLLYVALLALLRAVWTSPLLPRVISSLAYVLLFLGLAISLFRGLRRASGTAAHWLMATALLAVMVEPSAARWLDDGMETGLVFLDTFVAVLLLRSLVRARPPAPSLPATAFAFGLVTVLLRVELLMLVGCVSLMGVLNALHPRSAGTYRAPGRARLGAALMPLLGGLTGAAIVRLTMGALLPDTAIAKAFGASHWDDTVRMGAITVGSSFSFGIGLLLLWLGSFAALLAACRVRLADLCANALFPAVLLVSAARGQQIQGIRYFGWTFFFPLLWNLLRSAEDAERFPSGSGRALGVLTILLLCALIPAAVWESKTFYRLFQGRGSALNAFRAQNLTGLRGKLGIAEDVGFIGYFTQGDLCDPYGLVNGRAVARLTYQPRFDRCMSMHPVFAFGSEVFLHRVHEQQNLKEWFVCGRYRFDNVRTSDTHFLVVAPNQVQATCPDSAQPVASALPAIF